MDFSEELKRLEQQGLYRSRRVIEETQFPKIVVDGRKVINFCSNDYLGLSQHPSVKQAFIEGVERYGAGSGSAHLICGHSQAHHALEEELADFTGRDRALLFSTGFMANIGTLSALLKPADRVLEDRLNHASLLDGGLLSRAKFRRYQHNDMSDLKNKLSLKEQENTLIVSDGVFSMDGDLAPLPDMVRLARQYKATLMVDDAHGFGVLGGTGAGVLEHYGLKQQDVPILMGTLGKAVGTFGAFVAGSEQLIEILIQKARSYIYTTAMPAALAEATRVSLRLVQTETWRREQLMHNIQSFRFKAEQRGLPVMASGTAIQPLLIGSAEQAMTVSQKLMEKGFWVSAIRPPTVPKGQARLRVTLSAVHQPEQIDGLLDALEKSIND